MNPSASAEAFVSVLALYYHYGALTPRGDNGWRVYNGHEPFVQLKNWLDTPTKPDPTRLQWIVVGFLIVCVLSWGRTRFAGWPLHPAGFALAHAGWAMPWVWCATLLGWLAKS